MNERQYRRYLAKIIVKNMSSSMRELLEIQTRVVLGEDPGPAAGIEAQLQWLCRAQDMSTTSDGGVARHFSLDTGWSASYPETTGYIIPTLLRESRRIGHDDLHRRACRMLDWLVSIQMGDGGFQGGTIVQTPVVSVTFNTGQILIGLAAGVAVTDKPAYRDAMNRAARFLTTSQDSDGCWRRHRTPFAAHGDKAYETHVAWGLFEADRLEPGKGYGESGLAQVDWALQQQRENGWFANNCLTDVDAPLTHTIGYVLRGVIEAYRLSGQSKYLEASIRTAEALLDIIEPDGRLPGRLDARWKPAVEWACCTGIAQIAICWFMLSEITGREDFLAAARRANAFGRRTAMTIDDRDVYGAVMGSWPFSGDYGRFEALNWAAKFTIDANCMELDRVNNRSVLQGLTKFWRVFSSMF